MIEKTVLQHLSNTLPAQVCMEVPENPPDKFVLVEKTGSSQVNRINHATLAVQSWAGSMMEAAELNEQVKTSMDELSGFDDISACRLNSDYNFTDTTTKHYRYQAVFDLVFY